MNSDIETILNNISLLYKRKDDINQILDLVNPPLPSNNLKNLVESSQKSFNDYRDNSNNNNFNTMTDADKSLAQYLEDQYPQDLQQKLSVEIISGDKLKEKLNSTDINVAATYSGIRYIVNKEFAMGEGNIYHNMALGKVAEDFDESAKWFLLYDHDLIVSVLCYLSLKIVHPDDDTDNLQSFATRSDSDKIKFRNKGYNNILMKYTLQYLNKLGCTVLKLGVEPHNFDLVNVYSKVGFELVPVINLPNKFMKYMCPKFETIKFVLPEENQPKITIPSFDLPNIISWTGSNSSGFYYTETGMTYNLGDIHDKICSQPDPTNKFQESLYKTEYNTRLIEANNKFNGLTNDEKIKYYIKARELSELRLWSGGDDIYLEVNDIANDIQNINGIYDFVKRFKPGYQNNYYLTESEYQTTNDTIKIRVAQRYYITQYLLDHVKQNGQTLTEGIQRWRQAFYDIRMIFLPALRKKVIEYNNIHPGIIQLTNLNIISKIEAIFSNCLQPHSYFNLSLMRNGTKSLMLNYINQGKYPDENDAYKFVSLLLNPFANLANEGPKSIDKNGLSEEQITEGIAAVYLLSWDYEHYLTNMMHEIMHTFRYSDELNHILFDNLYPFVDQLNNTINFADDEIRKLELIADIISFMIMSILLEHSGATKEEKYNLIKKMPLPICGGGDPQHPPGKLRINTMRIIPSLYSVLNDQMK